MPIKHRSSIRERRANAHLAQEEAMRFFDAAKTLGKLLREHNIPAETAIREQSRTPEYIKTIDQFPESRSGWSIAFKPSMPKENRKETQPDLAPGPSGDLLVLTRSLKVAHLYATTPLGTEITTREGQPLLTGIVEVAMGIDVNGTSRALSPAQIENFIGSQRPDILYEGLSNLALTHSIPWDKAA
jgi:hypothetical protein